MVFLEVYKGLYQFLVGVYYEWFVVYYWFMQWLVCYQDQLCVVGIGLEVQVFVVVEYCQFLVCYWLCIFVLFDCQFVFEDVCEGVVFIWQIV